MGEVVRSLLDGDRRMEEHTVDLSIIETRLKSVYINLVQAQKFELIF
jgi:hypothetical protein